MTKNQTTVTEKEQLKLTKKAEKRTKAQAALTEKAAALRQTAEKEASPRKKSRLLRRVEALEISANHQKVRAKQLTARANGEINDKEWSRISKSRRNHWFYDRISAVVTAFRRRNPLREEGKIFDRELGGEAKRFENKGRIFLGGTKAMNRYVDEKGNDWLCKEAVTCVGTKKPMGALVTEAASRLQEALCPEAAVRSFVYRDEKGEVCGSLQERLDVDPDAIDLFKWQTEPDAPLPAGLAEQILREHVTDWLLCNFDTKGENFLIDTNGTLRGIDKEQAFSYLDRTDTQEMSYTYSPNPNPPLYNTVFERYVNGSLALDLTAVQPYIDKATAMPREEYEAIFRPVVEAKCKGNPTDAQEMMQKIVARKDSLADEYKRFFDTVERDRARIVGQKEAATPTTAPSHATEGKTATPPAVTVEEKHTETPTRRALDLSEHFEKHEDHLRTATETTLKEPELTLDTPTLND